MSDLIDFQKNNLLGVKYPSFDGLTYINTYSVEAFKLLANCETLYVKALPYVNQLFFTYGCNIGFVAVAGVPKEPMIAIVINSSGRIFPLLMEKSDIGKTTLPIAKLTSNKKSASKTYSNKKNKLFQRPQLKKQEENWEIACLKRRGRSPQIPREATPET